MFQLVAAYAIVFVAGSSGALAAQVVARQQSDGEVALRPFGIGERLTYAVRVGPLGRGTAVAEIRKLDTLRGKAVYHSVFSMSGSLLFFGVNDVYESWFDPKTFVSLRYHQKIDQGSYERDRTYEIYPERGVYAEGGKPETATVELPLDDGAFLYFMRTMPLE